LTELGSFTSNGSAGQLNGHPRITENIILSTCNRLEVYAVTTGEAADGWQLIVQFLSGLQGIPIEELRPHLYFMKDQEAVIQLMRVAAGLDSMILGEPQILGQVSSAWTEAHSANSTGPILSHLFDGATHAGKRARTETEIGRHTTSISHAAARLIVEKVDDVTQSHIAIIGAGEMAVLAAQALQAQGVRQLSFLNRTYSRAETIASQFNSRAHNWSHLPITLATADAVITATGAPHIVLHERDVRPVLAERAGRPLLFVDIAVPRDVEESVGELPGVQRYDIDQLQSTVEANLAQRQAAIPNVEEIIAEEAERFDLWLQGRQVLPVLVELRRRANDIAESELERHRYHLDELAPENQEKVTRMVYRIVNKVLHEPTVRLKASAAEGNGVAYAHAIRELFALEMIPVETELPVDNQTGNNSRPESAANLPKLN
jgi:glutamyl-tRNA reductase